MPGNADSRLEIVAKTHWEMAHIIPVLVIMEDILRPQLLSGCFLEFIETGSFPGDFLPEVFPGSDPLKRSREEQWHGKYLLRLMPE